MLAQLSSLKGNIMRSRVFLKYLISGTDKDHQPVTYKPLLRLSSPATCASFYLVT